MGKNVLIVDDSVTMRDMLTFTLSNAGFNVIEAVDGIAAIELLENKTVGLVITDINMPRLDGVGLIRELRSKNENRSLPILCLTTESDPKLKSSAKDAGATGWLKKPFDPEALVKTVQKICL